MLSNTKIEATSGKFENCDTTQNNLDFFLSSPPKVVKKSNSKKLKNSNQSSNLTTTNELDKKSLLDSTQTPTDTATNADDYTRNTAGGNARPTPISADFAENIELNKTLLIEFVEALLEATPQEHKNPVAAALNALRETNKYKLTIPCLLDAFVCGLVKLNVPKEIIKLTTPILCEVLPDTTPELVERKLNEENNGFELEFFSQYHAENYDNFAGKFVDNSWLAELNKANWLKFEPCEVSEMPPAAEPEISQATGTHGDFDLPTQKSASIIDNAEAQKDAPANFKTNIIKGDAQKDLTMILNENTHTANNNAENATENTTNATNSASNIKTPPATKQAKKSKTSNKKPKFEYKYYSTGEKIADALQYLDNEDYDCWWKVLDAAKGAGNGGDAYKNIVEDWSRPASNYNSKTFEEQWRAVKGKKNQGYIYKHAAENGWQNLPAADENNYYYFNSNQNSKNFSNQNSNNKKENANNNAVPAEVKNNAKYILSQAKEYTNNHFDALKNHYYFKHLTNFHNVYLNYYKEQISAVIPQFDINTIKNNDVSTAEVISLQFIFFKDDGTTDKRPLTGGGKHFTYFECCKEAAKEPKDILFCEGVRTGLAVATALTGSKVLIVCCLDAGNLATVATKFKTLFPAANFGFLADNDIKENGKNVGVEAAFQAAKEIKASLFIPNYLSDVATPTKCDFYDILKHYNDAPFNNKTGVKVIKEILKNNYFIEISNQLNNYKMSDYGVVYESDLYEYSKTYGKKLTREKLKAVEAENGIEYDDKPIIDNNTNLFLAISDPAFSGIELSYDKFSDKKKIKRLYKNQTKWEDIKDTDYTNFSRRVERKEYNFQNGFINLKDNKIVIRAFNSVLEENSFDSARKIYDNLPEWDGKERLKNFVKDYLNDDPDVDVFYKERWGIMLFLYLCLHLKGDKFVCQNAFILYQKKGRSGKSDFCKTITFNDDLVCRCDLYKTNDKEQDKIMVGKTIFLIDELKGLFKANLNDIKEFLIRNSVEIRHVYERNSVIYHLRGVFLGTSNDKEMFPANEPALHRRFAVMETKHSYIKQTGHINNRDAGGIKENLSQLYAEAKYLIEKNGGAKFVDDFYNNELFPLAMKEITKYIVTEADLGEKFMAWANKPFFKADYSKQGTPVITTYLPDSYKPKDLPGLAISDVLKFCFNVTDEIGNKDKRRKRIENMLNAKGFVRDENGKFKTHTGDWISGVKNINYTDKNMPVNTTNESNCYGEDTYGDDF